MSIGGLVIWTFCVTMCSLLKIDMIEIFICQTEACVPSNILKWPQVIYWNGSSSIVCLEVRFAMSPFIYTEIFHRIDVLLCGRIVTTNPAFSVCGIWKTNIYPLLIQHQHVGMFNTAGQTSNIMDGIPFIKRWSLLLRSIYSGCTANIILQTCGPALF